MRSRRGTSLVELLMIMSACTVVLTLTGVLMQRVMRAQMLSRDHVNVERSSLRLSEQFRTDVHQARSVTADSGPQAGKPFLRLELASNRAAEYSQDQGTVTRVESGGTQPVWREEFKFPAASVLNIEKSTSPERLTLTITQKPLETQPEDRKPLVSTKVVPTSVNVEAIVGRNLRFSSAANDEGATK